MRGARTALRWKRASAIEQAWNGIAACEVGEARVGGTEWVGGWDRLFFEQGAEFEGVGDGLAAVVVVGEDVSVAAVRVSIAAGVGVEVAEDAIEAFDPFT